MRKIEKNYGKGCRMAELDKIVAVMAMAKELVQRREVLEGYEITIDQVSLYIGRYFGPINYMENEFEVGRFKYSTPILPYIISFDVQNIPSEKRPILSIICAISLNDLLNNDLIEVSTQSLKSSSTFPDIDCGRKPNSEIDQALQLLRRWLADRGVSLDIYSFSELDYAVLSIPAEPDN